MTAGCESIEQARQAIDEVIDDYPSLADYPQVLLPKAYQRARRQGARETKLPLTTFPPEGCPGTWTTSGARAGYPLTQQGTPVAPERLSRLQRRILAWLVAEDQRLRGTMAAEHQALVRALVASGVDKGNVSTSLKGLAAKGLVTITRTPGGRAEAVDLTAEGRNRVASLTASCE